MLALLKRSSLLLFLFQSALYKFVNFEWRKSGFEGAMFVYTRRCKPEFGFIILNRKSSKNWIQPVFADIEIQLLPPYLLYKTVSIFEGILSRYFLIHVN
jgi:Dcp1-like decapping family